MKKYIPIFILIFSIIVPINIVIFLILLFTTIPIYAIIGDIEIKTYIQNVWKGYDQLANTIFGGGEDETISSRLGRNYRGTPFERFVDYIFHAFFGWKTTSHCEDSIEDIETENDAVIK